MADPTQDATRPMPKFSFSVTGIPGTPVFAEVTGLDIEAPAVTYRAGSSTSFAPTKMPGLASLGNVTLKKGVFVTDTALWTWFSAIKMNMMVRGTIVVDLIDATGKPQKRWTLSNAFPVKLTGEDMKSDANAMTVESIEVAYETLTVTAL